MAQASNHAQKTNKKVGVAQAISHAKQRCSLKIPSWFLVLLFVSNKLIVHMSVARSSAKSLPVSSFVGSATSPFCCWRVSTVSSTAISRSGSAVSPFSISTIFCSTTSSCRVSETISGVCSTSSSTASFLDSSISSC